MNDIDITALELSKKIKNKELTVRQVVESVLERINEIEDQIQSFLFIRDKEELLLEADNIQEKINSGELCGVLAGVPIAIKDNICTKGIKTTCASKILENFIPIYDATVIKKIKEAGMIIIGKTNMDEFAMGTTTKTSAFQVTKNPRNKKYTPGGSSGGSAAAVASKIVPLSIGSDTGGSIRQPAAFCGITGMKPTYGLVSRNGLIAYASSFDQIGPMGNNVSDCAALLEVMSSYDEKDATSRKINDYQFTKGLIENIAGMNIGILQNDFDNTLENTIKKALIHSKEMLEQLGANVSYVSLPFTLEQALSTYYILACAEASSNLERYDGVKYGFRAKDYNNLQQMYQQTRTQGFGIEVKRRIMLGTFTLSSGYYEDYYKKALKVRNKIKNQLAQIFEQYDVLLMPTAPVTGIKLEECNDNNPTKHYFSDGYTVIANLAGLPAISVPYGYDNNGLPIGVQFVGNCCEDKKVIQAAYTYEQKIKGQQLKQNINSKR